MNLKNFFFKRGQILQKSLAALKTDGCLITDMYDLFYLTGLQLSAGQLIVLKNNICLFLDGRYFDAGKKSAPYPVRLLNKEQKNAFLKENEARTLLFDSAYTSYLDYETLKKEMGQRNIHLIAAPYLTRDLRLIKDAEEIKLMRKSAAINWKGFERLQKLLKVGVTEKELADKFTIFTRELGASGTSFDPIIAFGENSAFPHHRAGKRKLRKGDLVLIDIGVIYEKYCSDMTRVLFFGDVAPILRKLYEVVRKAQKAALALCKPGCELKVLDLAARKVMAEQEMEELYTHSLGHGVGLQIHEYPRIRKEGAEKDVRLEEGMVITIEPGLYLPGKGGVRYEDTIIITKDGYKNFYSE